MPPIEFAPVLPWFCFSLALLAVPIALAIRHLGSATRRHWLPPGWTLQHAVLTGLIGIVAQVAILLAGPVLEWATDRLLRGAGMGRDLSEPATWTAAASALIVWLSLQAWRLLLLGWPLLFALGRLAQLRWTARPANLLLLVAAGPVMGAAVVSAFPPGSPAHALAAAALLWTLPLQLAFGLRLLRQNLRRFQAWRHAPPGETTRISPMPAAMAASLEVGSGPTTGFVRVKRSG